MKHVFKFNLHNYKLFEALKGVLDQGMHLWCPGLHVH